MFQFPFVFPAFNNHTQGNGILQQSQVTPACRGFNFLDDYSLYIKLIRSTPHEALSELRFPNVSNGITATYLTIAISFLLLRLAIA